jgi:hypothetical protein
MHEVIGRMVETRPDDIAWLTTSEIASLGVHWLPHSDAPAPTPPPAAAQPAPATQSSFDQGLADRNAWEEWYSGLTGDYQRGAEWWAAHRSLSNPPSCGNPTTPAQRDWNAGCVAAQQRLASSDVHRKTDPIYRQGWNSY